ncbi:MAG: hypothetical protein Q9226_004384 [Calogaya cf. arnoldii]
MALGAVIKKTEQLGSVGSLRQDRCSPESSEEDDSKQGVDGSVIEFYPRFELYIREALPAVDGIGTAGERLIRMGLATDGTSVGAAIIALTAAQQV